MTQSDHPEPDSAPRAATLPFSPLRLELCFPDEELPFKWGLKDWIRTIDDVPGEMIRILKKWERVCVILKVLHDPKTATNNHRWRSQYEGCLGVRLLLSGVTIGHFAPGLPSEAEPPKRPTPIGVKAPPARQLRIDGGADRPRKRSIRGS